MISVSSPAAAEARGFAPRLSGIGFILRFLMAFPSVMPLSAAVDNVIAPRPAAITIRWRTRLPSA